MPSMETSSLSPDTDTAGAASYMLASTKELPLTATLLFFRDDFRDESLAAFDRAGGRAGVDAPFLTGRPAAFFAFICFPTFWSSSVIGGGEERGESPPKDIASALRFIVAGRGAIEADELGASGAALAPLSRTIHEGSVAGAAEDPDA